MWYNIIYYVSMFFGLLHRLRGTWSWFSKVNGIILGLIYFFMFNNYYIAIFGCVLYVLGESYGWGDPIGTLTEDIRINKSINFLETEDGSNNGIRFFTVLLLYPSRYKDIFYNAKITILTNIRNILNIIKLIKLADKILITPYKQIIIEDFIKYSRLFLIIRGIYWWTPTIGLLSFININIYAIVIAISILSFGWPLAAELGRYTARLWSKSFMSGGWEHQEVWYGTLITITFILLFTGVLNV